jgi:DNA-binding GntR family transcriptional regulator
MPNASKTKNVLLYEKLRQQIIKGKLKPGQRIVMADLAKAFGASETPVREAIRRLESEGYVIFTPHAGAVVTRIDEGELSEIYLIRIALEALATRLAGPHLSERDIEWLKRKNHDMETAIERSRYEILARLNKAFHLRIYKAAPYPRLHKMIADLWDTFERWPSVFSYVPERAAASVEEHKKIIEALAKGDMDLADDLMKAQKERALKALMTFMAKTGSPSPGTSGQLRKKRPPNSRTPARATPRGG